MQGDHHEPWTWVRTEGQGRVFYTAYGHDERTWGQEGFQSLVRNGILWAVGDRVRAEHDQYAIAPLVYHESSRIPNYERRNPPLKLQEALAPAASMTHIQVPPGFKLQLFASEPDIVKPIAMAWDERGRLWIAETVDYPNDIHPGKPGRDHIKILEDTDGDGRADKFTIFADSLNIPTSIVFSNGGIIVSAMPDFLFLKDTTGDDRADIRQKAVGGWGFGDTHAGPSNLRYGFDNHIWGAVGYSNHVTVDPDGDTTQVRAGDLPLPARHLRLAGTRRELHEQHVGARLLGDERRVRLDGEQHARDVRRHPASLPARREGAPAARGQHEDRRALLHDADHEERASGGRVRRLHRGGRASTSTRRAAIRASTGIASPS